MAVAWEKKTLKSHNSHQTPFQIHRKNPILNLMKPHGKSIEIPYNCHDSPLIMGFKLVFHRNYSNCHKSHEKTPMKNTKTPMVLHPLERFAARPDGRPGEKSDNLPGCQRSWETYGNFSGSSWDGVRLLRFMEISWRFHGIISWDV